MFRRAWTQLARKQYLFVYPLALGIISSLAFLAVYSASGGGLGWSSVVEANFTRWDYLRTHIIQDPKVGLALGAAVFCGVVMCVLQAMLRAPYFRAITGLGYPLAPRSLREVASLSGFYLLVNAVVYVLPTALTQGSTTQTIVAYAVLPFSILVVFGDYVVVFEKTGPLAAIKRSVILLRRRWPAIVLVWALFYLLWTLMYMLYGRYYEGADGVFFLLPLTQLLVEAFLTLFFDLILIFIYDEVRKAGP